MAVREATTDDADAIARVHVATWQHAYRGHLPDATLDALDVETRRAMWTRILSTPDHPAHVAVAEEDGAVVGFAAAGPWRDGDEPAGELMALYVAPSAQGRGHGAALLAAAEADLAVRGYDTAVLWVLATNAPTIGFYTAHGWRDDGADHVEALHGVDVRDRRYRKELAPPR